MRHGRRLGSLVIMTILVVAALFAPATAGAQQTIVSLTFDDGWADQYDARATLAAYGMKGTFYVNTGPTGTPGYMSWEQLVALDAEGHEVTGHTLDHADLVATASTNLVEARRQVCEDRQNLVSRGFLAKHFAYPYGEYNTTAKSIVRDCGYATGRGAFGLRNITSTTDTRSRSVSLPPPDPFAILTPCCIRSDVTLAQLQNYIVGAENGGGGWVPLVLHRICENCGGDTPAPSITPATFQAFAAWLSQRTSHGTVVRTVAQAISGDAQPATSSASCDASACSSGWYGAPVTVSLQAADTSAGVAAVRYTLDGSEPTVSSPLYSGPFAVSQTATVKFRSWDNGGNVEPVRSQLVRIDATAPVSSISCNGAQCAGTPYSDSVSVSLSAADAESGVAAIRYTLDGSAPTGSSPLYSAPFAVSETTTVRYRAWDAAGNVEAARSQIVEITVPPQDTTPPSSTIACDAAACSDTWYGGPVSVSLSATDDASGIAAIRYTLDGSEPTGSSPIYGAPFTVPETATVKFRAWDGAGNVEGTKSQSLQIDTVAPVSSITCNGSGCLATAYEGPVTVALSATDGESGVAAVRYTLDGSEPSAASPLYGEPFTVSQTTTVRYQAWDAAGNVEGAHSQPIEVAAQPPQDTTAPTSAIACDGSICSTGWYTVPVSVALSATDDASGVAAIRYTLDGSAPSDASPLYTGPIVVSQTATVAYRAWDNAGNVEPANSQLVRIDGAKPTVAITSPASGAKVKGNVKVTASAADVGSGVAQVSFYANGTLIGTRSGSGTVFVNWNTNKLKGQYTLTAVAEDVAGNSTTSAPVTVTAG